MILLLLSDWITWIKLCFQNGKNLNPKLDCLTPTEYSDLIHESTHLFERVFPTHSFVYYENADLV